MVKLKAAVVQVGSRLVKCGQGSNQNPVQVGFLRVNIPGYGYMRVACRAIG